MSASSNKVRGRFGTRGGILVDQLGLNLNVFFVQVMETKLKVSVVDSCRNITVIRCSIGDTSGFSLLNGTKQ